MKLTDCYQVGDTVEDQTLFFKRRGLVIKVTRNILTIRYQKSITTYRDINSISLFKEEIKVLGNINYTLRYTE